MMRVGQMLGVVSLVAWAGVSLSAQQQLIDRQAAIDAAVKAIQSLPTVTPPAGCVLPSVCTIPPTCSFTLSAAVATVPAAASAGTVQVTTQPTCAWQAAASVTWLTVAPASGDGSATLTYLVQANTLPSPRSGALTIGGVTFTVNQAASQPLPQPSVLADTFEYVAAAGECGPFTSTGPWTACDQTAVTNANPCTLSTVTSIPGYTGAMPSGSRALRIHARAASQQTSCHLQVGNEVSPTGTIPADAWYQFAIYINHHAGSGETSDLSTRAWKMLYPCNGPYPCTTNYWLMQMGAFNYNPTNTAPNGNPSPGHAYLILRDNMQGSISWSGAPSGDQNKLGQTSTCDHLVPNTWKIVKAHINTNNPSASSAEVWLGNLDGTFCKVMDWRGGTTVAGSAFTWTVPTARGHRSLAWPTTHPSNNVTGQETWVYYDDFVIATTEAGLPRYGAAPAVQKK